MPKKKHVKIVKVYLSREERPPDRPQDFPRMPRLYLELLENKAKIKQDLIGKEHISQQSLNQYNNQTENTLQDLKHDNNHEDKEYYDRRDQEDMDRDDRDRDDRDRDDRDRDDRDRDDRDRNDRDRDDRDRGDRDRNDRDRGDRDRGDRDRNDRDHYDVETKSPESGIIDIVDSDSDAGSLQSGDEIKESSIQADDESVRSKDSDDDLSDRLKELLNDTDKESSRSERNYDGRKHGADKYSVDKYSVDKYSNNFDHRSSHRSIPYRSMKDKHRNSVIPPTLAELEAQGQYNGGRHLRDINQVNFNDHEIDDQKREMLFKFVLLKKSYPHATIPEFSIHSDLGAMKKSYDDSVRHLSLDSSVERYKQYLIGGFMLTEFIFGNFLGFDMQGFTQQQIVSMNSYEKLLIELGEKSYVPKGSSWPVELRLLFLIIMNAAFFIVGKMIMRKTGANLMGMINNMNTPSAGGPLKRKRRMRGPNIDLDDLPEEE